MPKRIRKASQKILLAATGVLAALALLELGARLLPTPFAGPHGTADVCSAQFGWRGRPNYQTTVATDDYVHDLTLNSSGMHDDEHPRQKAQNSFRILMLGDSFVRAHQVIEAETAHQVLEQRLNEANTAQNFEVISAGVDAWGTGQELLYYRLEGRLYQPDLVLLMVYLGNDIQDNLPGRGLTLDGQNCYAPYFALCDDRLDPEPWLYAPGLNAPTGRCLPGQKLLLNTLGQLHQHSRLYTQLEPLLISDEIEIAGLDFYTGENELFDYAWQLTVVLIDQIHREVAADGAELRVVLISPSDLIDFTQMSAEEREEIYQRLPGLRRAEQLEPPNQKLAKILADKGIQVLDLLPIFGQHINETGEALHFEHDKHWNTAGNRLVGEAIYDWLQKGSE